MKSILKKQNNYENTTPKKWSIRNYLPIKTIRHPIQAFKYFYLIFKNLLLRLILYPANRFLGIRKPGILILDTIFPFSLSAFRLQEFLSYLEHFDNSFVLTTGEQIQIFGETRSLKRIITEFVKEHPHLKGRTRATSHYFLIYKADLAYTVFISNLIQFLKALEQKSIPFIFTLYPGGGFKLGEKDSDDKLRQVFNSPLFRKVIVTQNITLNYLVNNKLCPRDKIAFIYGGVVPLDELNRCKNYKRQFFGSDKDTLDICFVAHKYMDKGIDKGYDIFIEVAKKLAQLHHNIHFHIVGGFSENDISIEGLEGRITFHGVRPLEWFNDFYFDKDIILSPNIPFILDKGAIDGFPTSCCAEAGMRKVAMFCTDELKLNGHFIDTQEMVIIPHDSDKIVKIIDEYYREPEKLRWIGEKGALKIQEVFSYENQILPRIRLLENELAILKKENNSG